MGWSRWRTSPYYRPSLISLGLHATLVIVLSVSWLWSSTPKPAAMIQSAQEPVDIIQATAVSEQAYQEEVKEIEQAQLRAVEQAKQQEQQRVAAEQAAAAEQQRQVEEQQRKVQAEQQKIAEQKLAEAQRLAEQQQKIAEEQRKAQAEQAAAEQKKIEEQQKAEAAKRLAEQQKAQAAAAEKAAAEAQRKAQQEQLKQQQIAAEQAALAEQQQAYVSGELNRFDALITQKIASVWSFPVDADPSLQVRLAVRVAPDGSVLSARVQQSSGNAALDQSALDAVYKASPLPVSTDPRVFNEMRNLDVILTPQMRQ